MEFVDSHCHLQFDKLRGRLEEVLADAAKAGVGKMVCVGTSLADSAECVQVAETNENIWATAGAHPHYAQAFVDAPIATTQLKEILNKSSICAVGEIGLDYYKDYCPREVQKEALHSQIKVGLEKNLPFIFHVRDAWDDFWEVFDCYCDIRGVIHSFSSGSKELDRISERNRGDANLYIGLNGIMTFSKEPEQLAAARAVPPDRLILETDAPFLAPAGFRGQVCEPKHLKATAEFLASLRGESLEKLATVTTKNAEELFGI